MELLILENLIWSSVGSNLKISILEPSERPKTEPPVCTNTFIFNLQHGCHPTKLVQTTVMFDGLS